LRGLAHALAWLAAGPSLRAGLAALGLHRVALALC